MKILYLYAEAMGYTMATIRALVNQGAEVHLVHDDRNKLTPYKIPTFPGVQIYPNSTLTLVDLTRLASSLNPDVAVVSGWVNKNYLAIAKQLRSRGGVVVTGLDNPWRATMRQYGAALSCKFGYLDRFFSHVWVAGPEQYEYARRLGFARNRVLFNLYSADLDLFHRAYTGNLESKRRRYPHRFLFVGRFAPEKGLDVLASAWKRIEAVRGDWELYLVGNGPMRETLTEMGGVVVKDFLQPEELLREVAAAGCFVLPSRREPWGVVVHEFSASGMPLILSDEVGAAASFLLPGYNGFRFAAGDDKGLAKAMAHIIALSDEILLSMGGRSYELSTRITPETSAASLLVNS